MSTRAARLRAEKKYDATPAAKKRRAGNNKARRKMIKLGKAHKGDGKDVAHLDNNVKNDSLSNLQLQSKSKNRSFNRDSQSHRAKGPLKKKKKSR